MDDKLITTIVQVLTAVVGVSIIAVLVSKNANTAGVLTAGGSAFSSILKTAVSPVSGGSGIGSLSLSGGVGSILSNL